jgi:hypothetical protein
VRGDKLPSFLNISERRIPIPSYNFKNKDTGEEFTEFMTMSQRESYLESNPHIEQIPSTIRLADPASVGLVKPPDGFREVLRKIKKNNRGASINTW